MRADELIPGDRVTVPFGETRIEHIITLDNFVENPNGSVSVYGRNDEDVRVKTLVHPSEVMNGIRLMSKEFAR